MAHEKRNDDQSLLDELIAVLSGLPWPEVLEGVWKILRKAMQSRSHKGMYEVLAYESTLELKDRGGKRAATFKKREIVRYLQDNVIAYQDQACGDGEILVNYRCTSGTPVDRPLNDPGLHFGHKIVKVEMIGRAPQGPLRLVDGDMVGTVRLSNTATLPNA